MHIIAIVGQIIFGLYWIMNAINHFRNLSAMSGYAASKHVPFPKVAVAGSGVLLLIGGLGIITGVYIFWAITDPQQKMTNQINFMKNMALLGALFILWSLPILGYQLW